MGNRALSAGASLDAMTSRGRVANGCRSAERVIAFLANAEARIIGVMITRTKD